MKQCRKSPARRKPLCPIPPPEDKLKLYQETLNQPTVMAVSDRKNEISR